MRGEDKYAGIPLTGSAMGFSARIEKNNKGVSGKQNSRRRTIDPINFELDTSPDSNKSTNGEILLDQEPSIKRREGPLSDIVVEAEKREISKYVRQKPGVSESLWPYGDPVKAAPLSKKVSTIGRGLKEPTRPMETPRSLQGLRVGKPLDIPSNKQVLSPISTLTSENKSKIIDEIEHITPVEVKKNLLNPKEIKERPRRSRREGSRERLQAGKPSPDSNVLSLDTWLLHEPVTVSRPPSIFKRRSSHDGSDAQNIRPNTLPIAITFSKGSRRPGSRTNEVQEDLSPSKARYPVEKLEHRNSKDYIHETFTPSRKRGNQDKLSPNRLDTTDILPSKHDLPGSRISNSSWKRGDPEIITPGDHEYFLGPIESHSVRYSARVTHTNALQSVRHRGSHDSFLSQPRTKGSNSKKLSGPAAVTYPDFSNSNRRRGSQDAITTDIPVQEQMNPIQRRPSRRDLQEDKRTKNMSSNSSLKDLVAQESKNSLSNLLLSKDNDVEIGDLDDMDEMIAGTIVNTTTQPQAARITPFTSETAAQVRKVVLGNTSTCLEEHWMTQAFTFTDNTKLPYGIVQKKGGPCGILAAVQAYIILELLWGSGKLQTIDGLRKITSKQRSTALCSALSKILWKAGGFLTASVAIPSGRQHFVGVGKYKNDGVTETLTVYEFSQESALYNFLSQHLSFFEKDANPGAVLLMYSALLSRGIQRVKEDMDEPGCTFIGAHGYCTQELVNLLLTGQAVSNVFNDKMSLDSNMILKGISERSQIGLLSLFEHYESCEVGSFLKTPFYPIWVVCSESHFSVLFSSDRELVNEESSPKSFQLYYYDGLVRQEEEVQLNVQLSGSLPSQEEDLVPPLEHCIRTRWPQASITWHGHEPIL